MKNLPLLLLLLILPSIQAFSQYYSKYKIKTEGSLELGYEDRLIRFIDNHGDYYGYPWLMNKGFASISLNASYRKFLVYTDVKTYFEFDKIYVYDPVQVEYWIGMTYNLGRFEFCVEHLCSHSISSNFFHEGHDKASVKIKLWGD
jgi:hypothetical protein